MIIKFQIGERVKLARLAPFYGDKKTEAAMVLKFSLQQIREFQHDHENLLKIAGIGIGDIGTITYIFDDGFGTVMFDNKPDVSLDLPLHLFDVVPTEVASTS